MPVYEFHCKACKTEFRTLRREEQLGDVSCPECGTKRIARLLSVTAASRTSQEIDCGRPGGCCRMQPGMGSCCE